MGCKKLTYSDFDTTLKVVYGDLFESKKSHLNYFPFGMSMPGRSGNSDAYKYGFGGQLKDDELKGEGNSLDFGARIYDPRIGRWMSVDPKTSSLPAYNPYNYCLNNPLLFFDSTGEFPYPIYVRSFAPFETFGGGFEGDGANRGYTTSLSATSRVAQKFTVDPTNGTYTGLKTWSDPSNHPVFGSATEKPTGNITDFKSTKGKGGTNTVSFTASYAGANPLVPGSPDIDVTTKFTITENEKAGFVKVTANQVGDRFPACETFITDTKGNSLFIGVSPYDGDPYTSLPGDNKNQMMKSEFTIQIDKKGVFTGVKQGDKKYSVDDWNSIMKGQKMDANAQTEGTEGAGGSMGGGGSGGKF